MAVPTLQQLIEEHDVRHVFCRVIIGGSTLPRWTSVNYSFSWAETPTATIIVPGLAYLPTSVSEEAAVQIWFGYRVGVTLIERLVFGGAVVDSVGSNGAEIAIDCVMNGPRKLQYGYNRRISFDFDNVTAEESIDALMALAGVSNYFVELDPWLIGTAVPQTIQFSTYGEAINKISEVDGSQWYAMPTGQVRVEKRDQVPSPTARRTYFTSILTGPVESQPSGIGNPAARPRITDIQRRSFRDQVGNFIEVDGAVVVTLGVNGEQNSQQIFETVDGISGQFPNGAYWIPTPPLFQDFTFQNELIDTNAKAFEVAERYFDLKNRLFEELPLSVPGDPDVFLGETVRVKDLSYSGVNSLYVVKGYRTSIDSNGATTELQLTGGPEAGTTGFAAPFADFTWTYDAFYSGGFNPGGSENDPPLPPGTNTGAKLCEPLPEDAGDPTDPDTPTSFSSDNTEGQSVVYIGFNGTHSQDFDGYIVLYTWTWTDHLDVERTVTGPRWTLVINPDNQSSVEVTLVVTDNTGRTGTITKTVHTSVNYVPDPTNPDYPYDPNNSQEDTEDGGGNTIGECSDPELVPDPPYGDPEEGPCKGMEKSFLVAAKTVAMGSKDATSWNDLTKAAAGCSGDFISVDAGVNNSTQTPIAIFGTTAGEIVLSNDNCATGEVVFAEAGGRVECIHFDRQEMGDPGGDIPGDPVPEGDVAPADPDAPVPVYTFASPGTLTIKQAYQQCRLEGFSHDTAIVATGIMRRESGLYSKATNTAGNTPPSTDRGIAQWNDFYHPDISDACAYNTQCAIRMMYKKSSGGSDFSPWNVRGGSYLTGVDLGAIQEAVGALSNSAITQGSPKQSVAPTSLKVYAGTSTGRIYVSNNSGKDWTLYHDFGDGLPIMQLGTPPRFGAATSSLWAFGGDSGVPESLVRIDPDKSGSFVSLAIEGDLFQALVAAGSGATCLSSMNDTASIIVFKGAVSPKVWTNLDPLGDPGGWIPCTTSGTFNTVAPGFSGEFVVAGSTVDKTSDNETFVDLGAGPATVNHMLWRGLEGMYTAALDDGLYQSLDFGDSFGALRPSPDFDNTWPAGAVAYQLAVSVGLRACDDIAPTPCEDVPYYEAAAGIEFVGEHTTNDQELSNYLVSGTTALVVTTRGGSHNSLGKDSGAGTTFEIEVEPTVTDSFLFLALASRPGSVPSSITDSLSGTWDLVQSTLSTDDTGPIRLSIYRSNTDAEAIEGLTITVTFGSAQDRTLGIVDEFIGLSTSPGSDPVDSSDTAANTDVSPVDYPEDYALSYSFANSDANFEEAILMTPSFGIALQLAPCEAVGMFIVATNDIFSFDGAAVAFTNEDDPNQPAAPPNSSFCLKSFGGKLFWNARNSGDVGVIFRSEDGGLTSIVGGDLAPGFLTQFDIDADGNLYALYSAASDGLYRSTDDGDTWTLVIGTLGNATGNGGAVACHPTDVNRIAFIELVGGISALLRVSTNAGSSFGSTLITEIPAPGFNNFFGFQPRWLASGRVAWAFHEDFGALYVMYSDDDGASVAGQQVLMAFGTFQVFCGMWVDDNVLYLAAQDTSSDCHIFRSTNEGTSWTDLGVIGANSSYIQGVTFSDGTMYILNDAAEIWKVPSPSTTWVPELIAGTADTNDLNQDCFVTLVT